MSIKRVIKKYVPKSAVYRRIYNGYKRNAGKTYAEVEDEINLKYKKVFGREIDWENPKTYNEKLNVTKLYDVTDLKTQLTDKILVSDWVRKRVGNECKLIPLIASFDSVDEIDFDKLPEKYVMKMNNDSGSVFIHDKKRPVTKELIVKYKNYLQKRNYAYNGFEMQYKAIEPRIMIEKYMGEAIRDYKFLCFDGKCYSCRVDFDRFGDHTRNFYDEKWKILPYNKGKFKNYPEPVTKPKNYEKMWKLAEKLSAGFDQVRVDFYDIDDEVYFGEMTFTNGAGLEKFYPDEMDLKMGKLWKLDMKPIRERRRKLLDSGARIGD